MYEIRERLQIRGCRLNCPGVGRKVDVMVRCMEFENYCGFAGVGCFFFIVGRCGEMIVDV